MYVMLKSVKCLYAVTVCFLCLIFFVSFCDIISVLSSPLQRGVLNVPPPIQDQETYYYRDLEQISSNSTNPAQPRVLLLKLFIARLYGKWVLNNATICPSVCSIPIAQQWCILWLWLLYNTNKKLHAGSQLVSAEMAEIITYDFNSMFHSNYVCAQYHFSNTSYTTAETGKFSWHPYPAPFRILPNGLCEKSTMVGWGDETLWKYICCLAISTLSGCGKQTDRQTDRHACRLAYAALAYNAAW